MGNPQGYSAFHQRSIDDRDAFWAEQAALVPTAALRWPVRTGGDAPATLLWAMPTTHGPTTAPPPQDTRIA